MFQPIVDFQQELAGHVFYTGDRQRPYRWGIQSVVPDDTTPYLDECVSLTDAHPFGYWIRQDGRIEVDGRIHAQNAQVLVEEQGLQFEWDTEVRPRSQTCCLRLPVRPTHDLAFWQSVVNASQHLGLQKVEAASDGVRQWFLGPSTRVQLEPYYGVRNFSDSTPAHWAVLYSTSTSEAQAFHDLLASAFGWSSLEWQELTCGRRPADLYGEIRP